MCLTAFGDGAVVVTVRENRIEADAAVEVLLGSAYVAKVVFGYAAEEEVPVVGRVEAGQDIEVLYRLGVFPVGKGLPAAHVEDVLIVLGEEGGAQAQ